MTKSAFIKSFIGLTLVFLFSGCMIVMGDLVTEKKCTKECKKECPEGKTYESWYE